MPVNSYFKGKGQKVLGDMQDEYGAKKGKSVFYATANKNPAMKPGQKAAAPVDDNDRDEPTMPTLKAKVDKVKGLRRKDLMPK